MGKKKQEEVIVGLGQEDKLVVQKSLPLLSLWKSDITLAEFKILDTYLARINSHNPSNRKVVFSKGELEEKLGVTRINHQDLKDRLTHLMGNVVQVQDRNEKKGFRLVTLFEECQAEQDEYGGWTVTLECTEKAKKYFFNVDDIGYLRYKLRCVTAITSRYSYIMFNYLESNRFRKSWTESIDKLKIILNCDTDASYNEFKAFNRNILKRAHQELNEKTECKYNYELVKTGRTVVGIRFTVSTLADLGFELPPAEIEGQMNIFEIVDENGERTDPKMNDYLSFLSGACKEEFDGAEMGEIFSLVTCLPDYVLPHVYDMDDDINFRRYHYLMQKYSAMEVANGRKKISDRYAYFKKMIQNDCVETE